jgi:hypothetical protein
VPQTTQPNMTYGHGPILSQAAVTNTCILTGNPPRSLIHHSVRQAQYSGGSAFRTQTGLLLPGYYAQSRSNGSRPRCLLCVTQGSTCAFAESILRTAGCSTGLFTSPHLVDIRERFRLGGCECAPVLTNARGARNMLPALSLEGTGADRSESNIERPDVLSWSSWPGTASFPSPFRGPN